MSPVQRQREDLSDLPASGIRRRPVYERLLKKRHYMIDADEPPTPGEIADAEELLKSSFDDELRAEALDVLRLAGE